MNHMQKELLTVGELAAFLKCSESLIYKLTAKKGIPYSRFGKRIYFEKNTVLNWLLDNGGKNV